MYLQPLTPRFNFTDRTFVATSGIGVQRGEVACVGGHQCKLPPGTASST